MPEQYVAPDGHTWWGTYLYANDWKYWTMGDPVERTILINRTNQEIDGGSLRRPDRWTLETAGRDKPNSTTIKTGCCPRGARQRPIRCSRLIARNA